VVGRLNDDSQVRDDVVDRIGMGVTDDPKTYGSNNEKGRDRQAISIIDHGMSCQDDFRWQG
jgi:hypothetical protein